MSYSSWKRATRERLRTGSQIATTARGPVEYAAWGAQDAGAPVVLIAHGTPGGYDRGLVVARRIGDPRFRYIALSRPGYLRTALDLGRSPENQADVLAALLDALGVDRAAVIGNSGGGPSALQFALRHPERCWAMVLISAVTERDPRGSARHRALRDRLFGTILGHDAGGWVYLSLLKLTSGWQLRRRRVSREQFELDLAGIESIYPVADRRLGSANDEAQFAALPRYPLERIRTATLIVHGAADTVVPAAEAEFAARAIPHAELFMIPGAGHTVFGANQSVVAGKIVEFLDANRPAGAKPMDHPHF